MIQNVERLVEPVVQSVEKIVDPVVSELDSFSWLYRSVLSFIESLTGNVMGPSDTIREYLTRITHSLSEGAATMGSETPITEDANTIIKVMAITI